MRIFYRILIILLGLGFLYSAFGIFQFHRLYYTINSPRAEFQVKGDVTAEITLVEFLNYRCGYCKQLDPIVNELLEIRKDIRYVARPVSFDQWDEENQTIIPDALTKYIIAAGLQGQFWEMHSAVLEYPDTNVPFEFIEETAMLFGLDVEKLKRDADGKEVQKIIAENFKAFEAASLDSVPAFIVGKNIYVVTNDNIPDLKALLTIITEAQK